MLVLKDFLKNEFFIMWRLFKCSNFHFSPIYAYFCHFSQVLKAPILCTCTIRFAKQNIDSWCSESFLANWIFRKKHFYAHTLITFLDDKKILRAKMLVLSWHPGRFNPVFSRPSDNRTWGLYQYFWPGTKATTLTPIETTLIFKDKLSGSLSCWISTTLVLL